ncbi:MAG: hypothetical protein ACK5QX_12085, partial [bacterium]
MGQEIRGGRITLELSRRPRPRRDDDHRSNAEGQRAAKVTRRTAMNETLHRKVGRNSEEDAELSAALGVDNDEPLLDRAALLRMVSALRAELASMR